jgi:sugar transferase EpsL
VIDRTILPAGIYRRCCKRPLDLIIALLLLTLLAPLLLLLALLVARDVGRPILFRQRRPGLGGRPFMILKFRTMAERRDDRGRLLPDAQRLTRLGAWLRRTQLDKLPELINVLRGEMSLIGPRPLLLPQFEPRSLEQLQRHRVRPGISGWTEVAGITRDGWVARFNHDARYVAECSLRLDLQIAWRSLRHVLHEVVRPAPQADEVLPQRTTGN